LTLNIIICFQTKIEKKRKKNKDSLTHCLVWDKILINDYMAIEHLFLSKKIKIKLAFCIANSAHKKKIRKREHNKKELFQFIFHYFHLFSSSLSTRNFILTCIYYS